MQGGGRRNPQDCHCRGHQRRGQTRSSGSAGLALPGGARTETSARVPSSSSHLHRHPIFIVVPCPHGGAGLLSNYSGRGGTSEIKIALSRRHSRAAADVRLSLLPSVPVPQTPLVAESCPGLPRDRHRAGTALLAAPGTPRPVPSPSRALPCPCFIPNTGRNGKKPLGKSSVRRSNLIKLTKSCTPLEITSGINKHEAEHTAPSVSSVCCS